MRNRTTRTSADIFEVFTSGLATIARRPCPSDWKRATTEEFVHYFNIIMRNDGFHFLYFPP